MDIRGINANISRAIIQIAGLDPSQRIGNLQDRELKKIENILKDPQEHGIPGWMLNRQKDRKTGLDNHIVGSDLALVEKFDIDRLKKIKCWRGVRHHLGLKVRGQRTKSTGRGGQTVGVAYKKRQRR